MTGAGRILCRTAILALVCAAVGLWAEVTLATPFVDHAVLQRELPVPIWGRGRPGEIVTVTFAGQRATARTDAQGRWRVTLAPLAANAVGAELVVVGDTTVTVRDVVVGDVWLCSGQSNMELAVADTRDAAREIAAADFPLIRHLKVRTTVAAAPAETAATTGWEIATPQTVGRFTGVGYYFARQLQAELGGGIPIGLLNASVGSTPAEAWMDEASLASAPAFAVVDERWRRVLADFPAAQTDFKAKLAAWEKSEAAAKAGSGFDRAAWLKEHPKPLPPPGPGHRWTPRGLFNGMIQPLVPYALRGVLWYQGERNAADDHVAEYHALFAAMITGWRRQFDRADLPFLWVNLPNLVQTEPTGRRWAFLREAQTQTLSLPHTGEAVTIDIGDPHNIHPANKQDVAARLVLLARHRVYGHAVADAGPTYVDARVEGAAIRVRFREARGLQARGGSVQALEIAGADRVFHPAQGSIDGETLVVSAPTVPAPVAVRYAFTNAPNANLYNAAGLPAVPFRSDNWPP